MPDRFILAIDQGTTSTRAIVFNAAGRPVAVDQLEHRQWFPRAGWVEHDALEIWRNTRVVVAGAMAKANVTARHISAAGVTNQRETVVIWDRHTGLPIAPAIVWQDTRTADLCDQLAADSPLGVDRFRDRVGLPLATYFAGPKLRWLLDHVPGARDRAAAGDLLAGTIDSWLVWNMTGGTSGGIHITDVTNASRTMLMDLRTRTWAPDLCDAFDVPLSILPTIRTSCEVYGPGRAQGMLPGVPIAGVLGDQQAALFGQACFSAGTAKSTYGTGSFTLLHTGTEPVTSHNGLLTTLAFERVGHAPTYALEGSIAVTGSLIQWLRDNLGIISAAPEVEALARSVADHGGAYFVPAFSGLFAPYWRPDARGALVGLTRFVTRGHIARAALEATAFQTADVLDAMRADSGVPLTELKVDGGMVANSLLMQFQADILGVDVVRPTVTETTALGAAYAAGLAVGFWSGVDELTAHWGQAERWVPHMTPGDRAHRLGEWHRAVDRTYGWSTPTGPVPLVPASPAQLPATGP